MPRKDTSPRQNNLGRIYQHFEPIQRESLKPFILKRYKTPEGVKITRLKPSPVLLEGDGDFYRKSNGARWRMD